MLIALSSRAKTFAKPALSGLFLYSNETLAFVCEGFVLYCFDKVVWNIFFREFLLLYFEAAIAYGYLFVGVSIFIPENFNGVFSSIWGFKVNKFKGVVLAK